jgi:hypothetical protein
MTGLGMGAGTPLYLNVRVATAASAGTSLNVQLLNADSTDVDNGTEGTNYKVICESGAVPQASLTAGAWLMRRSIDTACDTYRYLGIQYTASGSLTGCTVDAWIDFGPQSCHNTQVAESNI